MSREPLGFCLSSGDYDPAKGEEIWFCLHSQTKHEHIAAAFLRKHLALEVFLPRIRYKKATARGPVWFVEAMFPNYLFCKFEPYENLVNVKYGHGLRGIVHFRGKYAVVHHDLIAILRQYVSGDEICQIPDNVKEGDEVLIAEGPFKGIRALVKSIMPAKQRVQLLFDFLGQRTETEIDLTKVISQEPHPINNQS